MMENEKMFEMASRMKLRFPVKGSTSTEDLWDLSLKDLDGAFKTLNAQSKQIKEESLLDTKSKEDTVLELKISIIKHIVEVKLAEKEKAKKSAETAAQKQKLMAILADKEDQDLKSKSADEIREMLKTME